MVRRVAVRRRQHGVNFFGDGSRDLMGPNLEEELGRRFGEIARTDEGREGRHEDQEGEERGQGRHGQMAGDRPAIVSRHAVERVQQDFYDRRDPLHDLLSSLPPAGYCHGADVASTHLPPSWIDTVRIPPRSAAWRRRAPLR